MIRGRSSYFSKVSAVLLSLILSALFIHLSLNYIMKAESEKAESKKAESESDRSCMQLTDLYLRQIADLHKSNDPSVYLIAPRKTEFVSGTICIGAVVAIPSKYSGIEDYGESVEDSPPDSIYLDIIGTDFTVIPDTVANFSPFNQNEMKFRYYQLNIPFRDSDSYKLTGYLEGKFKTAYSRYKLQMEF